MPNPLRREIKAWLSGGASNVDPGASLGGARSTLYETGVFQLVDEFGVIVPYPAATAFGDYFYSTQSWVQSISYANNITWGFRLNVHTLTYAATSVALTVTGGIDNFLTKSYMGFSAPVSEFNLLTGTGDTGYCQSISGDNITDYGRVTVLFNYETLPLPPPESAPNSFVDYLADCIRDNLISSVPLSMFTPGGTIYRCFYVKNHSLTASTPPFFFGSDFFGTSEQDGLAIEIGIGTSGGNGVEQTIANQTTAPVGVTFSAPGTPVQLPVLGPGMHYAMWMRMVIPAVFTPVADFDRALVYGVENRVSGQFETLSFAFSWYYGMVASVTDTFTITDEPSYLFNGGNVYDIVVEDDFDLTDDNFAFIGLDYDELTFTDEASAVIIHRPTVTDTITFDDDDGAVLAKFFSESITDTITFTDAAAIRGVFGITVVDEIIFIDEIEIDGEQYDGWVVNAETSAASFYRWGAFTSFTRFNGRYYGTTPEGIMQLDGSDDDGEPIDSFVLTGVDDFDIPADKRIAHGYIAMKTNGSVLLKTVVGDNQVRVYRLISTNDSMMSRRLPFGKGVDSYYWQLALENEDGADFEVDCIRVFPVAMKRRFR